MSQEDTDPPMPEDVWKMMNSYITINDSCSLALVSKRMWERARDHNEWRELYVDWDMIRKRGIVALFQSPSFKRVKNLIFHEDFEGMSQDDEDDDPTYDVEDLRDVLRCLSDCSTLKEIEFDWSLDISFSDISAELFSSAFTNLRGVKFLSDKPSLSNQQIEKFLEDTPKLKKLGMEKTIFTMRSAKMLGNITGQLIELNISLSTLPEEHIKELLEKCVQSTTLKKLNLSGINLSNIPSELLANLCLKALKLQNIDLDSTNLSAEQITSIMNGLSTSSLKKLCLANIGYDLDVSQVSAEVLSLATQIENVTLRTNSLTDNQLHQILIKAVSSTTLKKLDVIKAAINSVSETPKLYSLYLASNMPPTLVRILLKKVLEVGTVSVLKFFCGYNLTTIPPSLIIKLAPKLHSLDLQLSMLSTGVIAQILQALSQSNRIKILNLKDNILTYVSADLLADVAEKLSVIVLEGCALTSQQATKVLLTSVIGYMERNDLSNVNPELIFNKKSSFNVHSDSEGLGYLSYLNPVGRFECRSCEGYNNLLGSTSLSSQQLTVIFQRYCESQEKLLHININKQDLSNVPISLLTKFVSKFDKVALTNCNLTKNQVTAILNESIQSTSLLKALLLYGNNLYSSMPPNLIGKLYQLSGRWGREIYEDLWISEEEEEGEAGEVEEVVDGLGVLGLLSHLSPTALCIIL